LQIFLKYANIFCLSIGFRIYEVFFALNKPFNARLTQFLKICAEFRLIFRCKQETIILAVNGGILNSSADIWVSAVPTFLSISVLPSLAISPRYIFADSITGASFKKLVCGE